MNIESFTDLPFPLTDQNLPTTTPTRLPKKIKFWPRPRPPPPKEGEGAEDQEEAAKEEAEEAIGQAPQAETLGPKKQKTTPNKRGRDIDSNI